MLSRGVDVVIDVYIAYFKHMFQYRIAWGGGITLFYRVLIDERKFFDDFD